MKLKVILFFCVIDKKSENLWKKLKNLDERKKNLKENFWDEKRKIEEAFNKIKRDVFLYVSNVRVFNNENTYRFDNEFEKALFLYKADERIFDLNKGVNVKEFLKEKELFW